MRHGKAEDSMDFDADFERDLTGRGRVEAAEAAKWLSEQDFNPCCIVCSSANRTLQTAQICANVLSFPAEQIVQKPELYNAGVNTYLDMVNQCQEKDCVLMVGHNPSIAQLAGLFSQSGYITSFPTSSIAVVEFDDKKLENGKTTGLYLRN